MPVVQSVALIYARWMYDNARYLFNVHFRTSYIQFVEEIVVCMGEDDSQRLDGQSSRILIRIREDSCSFVGKF